MISVLKIGGSLAMNPPILIQLCQKLVELATNHTIVAVPGGGPFADIVREYYVRLTLSEDDAHRMAILAMDQYGLLLHSLVPNNSFVVDDWLDAIEVAARHSLPILLPSRFMLTKDPLEHSWRVTSDSISAYIAEYFNADRLILVKNVDGIYTSDPNRVKARMIQKIRAKTLLKGFYSGCVDEYLPKILLGRKKRSFRCYIVNASSPDRIKKLLEGEATICTEIVPR